MNRLAASELILNADQSVYHLCVKAEDLATRILLVGDPDRLELIKKRMERITFERKNREFSSVTGYYQGQRISAVSTGIGTDNIDIVVNELDAAFNIDPNSRHLNPNPVSLSLLRLGTSGAVHADTEIGTLVGTHYAIGLDGLGYFYELPDSEAFDDARELATYFRHYWKKYVGQSAGLECYGTEIGSGWKALIKNDTALKKGITLTAVGFYGPQGRALSRAPVRFENFPALLQSFSYQELSLLNIEMEISGLLLLSALLGHQAAAVCTVLANRGAGAFISPADYQPHIERLIDTGLALLLQRPESEIIKKQVNY